MLEPRVENLEKDQQSTFRDLDRFNLRLKQIEKLVKKQSLIGRLKWLIVGKA